jgi:hypothetical protein
VNASIISLNLLIWTIKKPSNDNMATTTTLSLPVSSVKIHTLTQDSSTNKHSANINEIHYLSTREDFVAVKEESGRVRLLALSSKSKEFRVIDPSCVSINNVNHCGWMQSIIRKEEARNSDTTSSYSDILFCMNNEFLQLFLCVKRDSKKNAFVLN